jgi:catechol-2,3-dioxygenase
VPTIERLAHVGLHVDDLDKEVAFYRDVLGLQVTDEDPGAGIVFLSARPDVEHHELLLAAGRTATRDVKWLQQVSFRCPSLQDVLDYYRRFVDEGIRIEYTVTHGNAISVYFYDPEDNIVEVYWPTGLKARQGFLLPLDFSKGGEELLADVNAAVETYGETGVIDMSLLARQGIHDQS